MKNQALFSMTDKSKKLKCRLLHFCLALQGLKSDNLEWEESSVFDLQNTFSYNTGLILV